VIRARSGSDPARVDDRRESFAGGAGAILEHGSHSVPKKLRCLCEVSGGSVRLTTSGLRDHSRLGVARDTKKCVYPRSWVASGWEWGWSRLRVAVADGGVAWRSSGREVRQVRFGRRRLGTGRAKYSRLRCPRFIGAPASSARTGGIATNPITSCRSSTDPIASCETPAQHARTSSRYPQGQNNDGKRTIRADALADAVTWLCNLDPSAVQRGDELGTEGRILRQPDLDSVDHRGP
jgi:hypothetical protein